MAISAGRRKKTAGSPGSAPTLPIRSSALCAERRDRPARRGSCRWPMSLLYRARKTIAAVTRTAMGPASRNDRAFFGRRKGHKLRPRQAGLLETLLPRLAIDLTRPAPPELAALFAEPVTAVCLEIGFGGGEAMLAHAKADRHVGF